MRKSNERRVTLGSMPQGDVLQEKMSQAGMTHGQTVLANLKNVRVENVPEGKKLYFCPMESVEVVGQITPGDESPIPEEVMIINNAIPGRRRMPNGYYNLNGVLLCSNGSIQISSTAKTRFKLVAKQNY